MPSDALVVVGVVTGVVIAVVIAVVGAIALTVTAAAGAAKSGRRTRGRDDAHLSQQVSSPLETPVVPRSSVTALAHEARTPLTSALGHLDLLAADATLRADHRETVGAAVDALERASTLLTDFLTDPDAWQPGDVLRADRRVDVDALVREALTDFGPLAGRRHVSISYDSTGPTPVRGDGRTLRQVVDNLLSNAVKYNEPDGWVDVRLTHGSNPPDGPGVTLEVTNPGTTLDDADTPRVFEPDFRGSDAAGRAEGHGVGLSVVHRIVVAHGGDVTYTSSRQTSTTSVRVVLPIDAP